MQTMNVNKVNMKRSKIAFMKFLKKDASKTFVIYNKNINCAG